MVTLLVFALLYYKQRVAFSDSASYLTDITRNDGFFVAHARFVSILNQWIPVILIKADASLKALAIAYSFNYSLVPVVLSLMCMHWLKKSYHAVAIMLLVLLMNSLLFFYTCSELQMGLCLLLFYDAFIDSAEERQRWPTFLLLSIFLVPFIAFSHPTNVAVFFGWIVYRVIIRRSKYKYLTLAGVLYIISYLVKKFWFTTSYEAGRSLSWETVRPFGLNYYNGPFAQSFYRYVVAEAFLVPVVLILLIIMLVGLRKYTLLIFLIGIITALFTIVIIKFEDWGSQVYDHYFEHMFHTAMFFLIIGFCYALSIISGRTHLKTALLALIFIISLAKINSGSELLTTRQRWLNNYLALMESLHLKKAVAGRVWIPPGMLKGSFWSCSWETLILSSLDGPEKSKTLFLAWNITEVKEPVHLSDEFISDAHTYSQTTLPLRYFNLGHAPYVFLEDKVPDSVLERLRWQ
jgi:hypothetical protein